MKITTKSALLGIILLLSTLTYAQNTKFGHINSASLLALMPATKTADGELQKYGQSLESQLKTMTGEYQSKVQDYQSKEALMADAIKQTKIKEITDLEVRIQEFQQTAQESIQKKKEELYSPILKVAEDAIKEVAKENGFTYIFDTSTGIILFSQDSNDISEMVKKKLGLTTPPQTPSKKDQAKP